MTSKSTLIGLGIVLLIVLAGCNSPNTGTGEQLAADTNQDLGNVTIGESYKYEVKITEKNQYGLVQGQPPFVMDNSLERQNLIDRYKYLNDRTNVHHVYLLSENGQVISYYTAQGKVSSVNSKLTNNRQIVSSNQCLQSTHREDKSGCFEVVESPQMDGSYGENGDAIFFFTTDGHYVEWNGIYLVSEEPKNIQSEVLLVDEVNDGGQTDGSS
ncbi:hypothetical protein [Halococcoides cellulosivorans]|uniref:Lipoprotein n=1 Tax=Halococcoides cellulosivorans TaxID=1679096 RepID=A0A2R4WY86_9EURY|nr:hypothetical protein [Halococcoides cellulosivorans]AWB26505.1 hypothetical protein HARCEL1_01630 [Halococcoides cellulosivorans]